MKKSILIAVVCLWLLASFLTAPPKPERAAAPLLQGAQVDKTVLVLLSRACQDCHSDSPQYPWYSYVAPVSSLVKDDVLRGRERLNLSRWSEYSEVRRQRYLSEIANQVRDRGMPLPMYIALHREARLSDAEVAAVFNWTQAERTRLITRQLSR